MPRALCEDVLDRVEIAIRMSREDVRASRTEGLVTTAQAGHMLEQAQWAARAYADYDGATVQRIVVAVADAAHAKAEEYAAWAVRETQMGVVADKVVKNQACSRGLLDFYAGEDFVSPRIDAHRKIAELPRPAGVVLAVTPATNPVASVYFKVLLCLMTRNAVVVAPHPRAKECCTDAARTLARAAEAAGAPAGSDPGRGGAHHPPDGDAHDRRPHRCDRGHRRVRCGARGVLIGQPGARGRSRQRADPGRRHCRRPRRGRADRGEQGLRQLGALHQRVGPRRRGRGRRQAAPRAGARRCARGRRRERGPAPSLHVLQRPSEHRRRRQGRVLDRGAGRIPGRSEDPGAGGALRPRAPRGADDPREALSGARHGAGTPTLGAGSTRPAPS